MTTTKKGTPAKKGARSKAYQEQVDAVKAAVDGAECKFKRRDRDLKERAQRACHAYATTTEQRHAAEALRLALEQLANEHPDWMPNLGSTPGMSLVGSDIAKARLHLVERVLQAINVSRHGHAEGSVAQHPDGRWARRYFSDGLNRLVWIVAKPPTDEGLEVEDVNEFGSEPPEDQWRVVGAVPWRVII